ncbi:hypothetical protein LPJ72_000071 [Coemansia sp. Benny D160-2]|nr:hypothetical protein LPJ72_000071 [Coemansia sp. Benny D160-2]
MDLSGRPQADMSERTWQASVSLRPGSCTIVDWLTTAEADDTANADNDHAENNSDERSDSEGSSDEGGGYASNSNAVPPAIANDPFFARLLKNAELYDSNSKKTNNKKRASRRAAKDTAEDDYDLEDPFIDDSEITFMDSHSLSKKQRKKRRKRNDGNNTENEGQGGPETAATDTEDAKGKGDLGAQAPDADAAKTGSGIARGGGKTESGTGLLEDLDKYEEDDFFVYYGPLNELESANEDEEFEKTDKKPRSRKQPEKKQPAKDPAPTKRKANGAAPSKGVVESSESASLKKKADGKSQHRRSNSESGAAAKTAQIPTNGRKSGARTSRKLESSKAKSMIEHPAVAAVVSAGADSASGTEDDARPKRPPIPEHDRPGATFSNSGEGDKVGNLDMSLVEQDDETGRDHFRKGETPSASSAVASSTTITSEDAMAINEAREPTQEIEAALEELAQATKSEAFENRQRFPSTLKPSLRQVCELSMARALEYDRLVLSLRTPEHKIFAWSTPMDVVGFTTGIYHRMAGILPYNRATVRKIVSKLLGHDLLTWKERQLKQIEDGLKARIDEQIERGMGWIPVGARTGTKESEDGASGGAQVRWHWTTISKHILYQYILLSLNMNELRNHLDQGAGKDGAYREQQARKDAYAHLVNLWPGSTMVTYEISRAYSSRKSLVEKQTKKPEVPTGPTKNETSPAAAQRAQSHSTLEATPVPPAQPEFAADTEPSTQPLHSPDFATANAPAQSVHSTSASSRYDSGFAPSGPSMSPYPQSAMHSPHHHQQQQHPQVASPTRADYRHTKQAYSNLSQQPTSPAQAYDGSAPAMPMHHQSSPFNSSAAVFDRQQQSPFAEAGAYAQTSPYYGGSAQSMAQQHGDRPQQFGQQHVDASGNGNGTNEDEYASPGSSRYSMSVHNLTSP